MNYLSTPPYKINSKISALYWKTEYNSNFISVENNTQISKKGKQIQIKKPFSQYKV
jgi:hypothetical protein